MFLLAFVLSLAAIGEFGHERATIATVAEDQFGLLEQTLNVLTQELAAARRENEAIVGALRRSEEELIDRLAVIGEQQRAIERLSSPILEIWDEVLVLPVIGGVDRERAVDMTEALLARLQELGARAVIVDVTGAAAFDTATADHFLRLARAASLLGARVLFTGISPENAATLVELRVDFGDIRVCSSLKDGLKACLRDRRSSAASAARRGGG